MRLISKIKTFFAKIKEAMLPALLLILVILCVNPISIGSFLQPISLWLHQKCKQQVPIATENEHLNPIYLALACGEKIPDGSLKQTFTALGIIHLMVISGTHLIFLEKIWSLIPSFRFKNLLLALFLLLYSMSAGLNPPCLRALFSLLLARLNKELKLFWSPYWRIQISGLLCLLCQNHWIHSLSLQLSWIASMGMAGSHFSRLRSCALTFVLLLPIISHWSNMHPLSIIINWVASPLSASLLLPLSILTLPFPFIRPLADFLWNCFLNCLTLLQPFMQNKGIEINFKLNSFQIWIYICLCFILLHFLFCLNKRKVS